MIIVLGPHRSGTSVVSNLLMELGVPFGRPAGFLGADEWSPRGYYEQADLLDLDSRIITGWPYTQGGWQRRLSQIIYATHPSPATLRRRFESQKAEVERLLVKYVGMAVKDPRLCLLWPLWHEAGPLEGVVICLRYPLASVLSLERRNGFPVTMGFRFWNWHMRSVLDGLSDLDTRLGCLWIDYDRLASQDIDQQLQLIVRFFSLPVSADRARECHARVFDPGLRHFTAHADDNLPPATRAIWEELRRRALHCAEATCTSMKNLARTEP